LKFPMSNYFYDNSQQSTAPAERILSHPVEVNAHSVSSFSSNLQPMSFLPTGNMIPHIHFPTSASVSPMVLPQQPAFAPGMELFNLPPAYATSLTPQTSFPNFPQNPVLIPPTLNQMNPQLFAPPMMSYVVSCTSDSGSNTVSASPARTDIVPFMFPSMPMYPTIYESKPLQAVNNDQQRDQPNGLQIQGSMMVPLGPKGSKRDVSRSRSPGSYSQTSNYSCPPGFENHERILKNKPPGFDPGFDQGRCGIRPMEREISRRRYDDRGRSVEDCDDGSSARFSRRSQSRRRRRTMVPMVNPNNRKDYSERRGRGSSRNQKPKPNNKKYRYRSKQNKIDAVYESLKAKYTDNGKLVDDDIVLRGDDTLRLHVKKFDALCKIEEALEEVEKEEPEIEIMHVSIPMSMKNKFQKKGFLVYLKLQSVGMIDRVKEIFQRYDEFKKCEVARPNPSNQRPVANDVEKLIANPGNVMLEETITDFPKAILPDESVEDSTSLIAPVTMMERGSVEVPSMFAAAKDPIFGLFPATMIKRSSLEAS